MAGFDSTVPKRCFFKRVLVCVNAVLDLPTFVTVTASSKQLPIECAKGRFPRAWVTAIVES
eukprot:6134228-Amphidinium_carterae.1